MDFYWTMDPLPKVSSVPRPARKSLEPSPAAWTRNLPQIYSEYWCKLGDSSRSRCDRRCDRFSAAICIAAAAASGAVTAAAPVIDCFHCDRSLHCDTSVCRCDRIAAAAGLVYCFSMFSFVGVNLWPNCQPGVLSWDLGHYFF